MVFMPFYHGSECVCIAEPQSFDRFKVSDYFSPTSRLSSFIVLIANSCHHTQTECYLLGDSSFGYSRKKKKSEKPPFGGGGEGRKKKKTLQGCMSLFQFTGGEKIYILVSKSFQPDEMQSKRDDATFAVKPRPHMQMWERATRGQTAGRSHAYV